MSLVDFLLLTLALGALAAAVGVAGRRAELKTHLAAAQNDSAALVSHELPKPRWWQRTRTDVIVSIAFALFAASVVSDDFLALPQSELSGNTQFVLARILSFLLVAPLAIRRRYPVESVAAIAVLSAVQLVLGFPLLLPANFAVLIALYSVTAYGPKWAGPAALTAAGAGAILLGARMLAGTDIFGAAAIAIFSGVLALAAWALGTMRRAQFNAITSANDRAAALAELSQALTERNQALEIERDQQAQIAAAAERARIAREMHDIIGHSIANIIVLANGASIAAAKNPAVAVGAFEAISETGTEALATTKQLLGVLRAPDTADQVRPEPGNIGRAIIEADPISIRALVTEVQNAGTAVEFQEFGAPQKLSSAATNTYYRVCQEALTNARKYGSPDSPVVVRLDWEPNGLTLQVENTLVNPSSPGQLTNAPTSGYGLIGMRERATLIGATVSAGPVEPTEPTGASTVDGSPIWRVTLSSQALDS